MQVTLACYCEDSSDLEICLDAIQETPRIPELSFETVTLAVRACF